MKGIYFIINYMPILNQFDALKAQQLHCHAPFRIKIQGHIIVLVEQIQRQMQIQMMTSLYTSRKCTEAALSPIRVFLCHTTAEITMGRGILAQSRHDPHTDISYHVRGPDITNNDCCTCSINKQAT